MSSKGISLGDVAKTYLDLDSGLLAAYSNSGGPYDRGNWQNRGGQILKIKDMESSHIQNCIKFLEGRIAEPGVTDVAIRKWQKKVKEFFNELATRKWAGEEVIVTNSSFELTEKDIVELARQKGCKIPESGAGIFQRTEGKECRLNRVIVRWTEQKKLRASASVPSSRAKTVTGKRASKRRR